MTALHSAAVSTGPIFPCWVNMCWVGGLDNLDMLLAAVGNIIDSVWRLVNITSVTGCVED